MDRKILCLFCAAWILGVSAAWASTAVVDMVQLPAWLERDNHVSPLAPGLEIKSGDRLRTGAGARVYLKLSEGSTVKLGESAQFSFQTQPARDDIFSAVLDIAAGAFRFTTSALQKLRKRNVSIRVGTATIGIRGTDVWGRSGKDDDLVMLIEGHIEVTPAVGEKLEMQQALTVFTAPKGGPAAPLVLATAEELKARARETEILPGDGSISRGGRWSLLLGSFAEERSALALYDRAQADGFAARIRPRGAEEGVSRYEVLLSGFADQREATAAALRVKARLGIESLPSR